jgi:hypothetical protein
MMRASHGSFRYRFFPFGAFYYPTVPAPFAGRKSIV